MLRLIAIFGVVAAFGGTLYYSGDYLDAWESPQASSAQAAPDARKKAKKKPGRAARRASAPLRATKPQPTWVAQMNALCRRGQAAAEAVPVPLAPAALPDYFRRLARVNRRWNRRAVALLERGRSRDPEAVRQLLRLTSEGESLMAALTSAVERRQFKRFEQLRQRAVAIAKSENRLLKRLGARDCTATSDYELS